MSLLVTGVVIVFGIISVGSLLFKTVGLDMIKFFVMNRFAWGKTKDYGAMHQLDVDSEKPNPVGAFVVRNPSGRWIARAELKWTGRDDRIERAAFSQTSFENGVQVLSVNVQMDFQRYYREEPRVVVEFSSGNQFEVNARRQLNGPLVVGGSGYHYRRKIKYLKHP